MESIEDDLVHIYGYSRKGSPECLILKRKAFRLKRSWPRKMVNGERLQIIKLSTSSGPRLAKKTIRYRHRKKVELDPLNKEYLRITKNLIL